MSSHTHAEPSPGPAAAAKSAGAAKSEPLLRLLICDLVGEDVTRQSLASLRDDIADLESRLDDTERTAHQLPHGEKYLLLVNGFMRRLLELHLELIDEVEQELAGDAATASTPPASAQAHG